jgi:CRP-like cAMP-binding protein
MERFYDIYDFPLFAGCDRQLLDAMLEKLSYRLTSYNTDDMVALQDSPCRSLYLLCEGSVCARMTNSDGKEITIETLKAPELLAPAFIYGSENRFPVSLQAASDCRLWIISKDDFMEMMKKDEVVLRNFLREISDRSLFLSRKLNEFALQNLTTRLLKYIQKRGPIQNLQEVAFFLGVARPSLSRAIAMLVEQKRIRKEGNGYVMNDKSL